MNLVTKISCISAFLKFIHSKEDSVKTESQNGDDNSIRKEKKSLFLRYLSLTTEMKAVEEELSCSNTTVTVTIKEELRLAEA